MLKCLGARLACHRAFVSSPFQRMDLLLELVVSQEGLLISTEPSTIHICMETLLGIVEEEGLSICEDTVL